MNVIQPHVTTYRVPVHSAPPQSIAIARALGRLFGRGIRGEVGTVRYGAPAIGTRTKFSGYASPPQLFLGYNPRKVAGGAVRVGPAKLPSASSPVSSMSNPLLRSMAQVTNVQLGG